MLTTSKMKRLPYGGPQKQKVLTTNAVKLKDEKDILANAIAQRDALAKRVRTMPTRKVSGPMLVTGGTEGRAQNEKRKRLMQKLQLIRLRQEAKTRAAIKAQNVIPIEKTVIHQVEAEIKPDGSMIALEDSKPEKKKRGRPKKEIQNES